MNLEAQIVQREADPTPPTLTEMAQWILPRSPSLITFLYEDQSENRNGYSLRDFSQLVDIPRITGTIYRDEEAAILGHVTTILATLNPEKFHRWASGTKGNRTMFSEATVIALAYHIGQQNPEGKMELYHLKDFIPHHNVDDYAQKLAAEKAENDALATLVEHGEDNLKTANEIIEDLTQQLKYAQQHPRVIYADISTNPTYQHLAAQYKALQAQTSIPLKETLSEDTKIVASMFAEGKSFSDIQLKTGFAYRKIMHEITLAVEVLMS